MRERHRRRLGAKLEVLPGEVVIGRLVVEEDHLDEFLAAQLEPDGHLLEFGLADRRATSVNDAVPVGRADPEAALADVGEYGVGL